MLINQANLAAIYKNFNALFNKAFKGAKPLYQRVATVVPSSTRSEEYKWLGLVPMLREWLGERIVKNLTAHSWEIKNKDWELTIEVDRNDIEDDSISVFKPLVQSIGDAAAMHPDEIIFALFAAGFSALCYDGQYFLDTDHPGPGGSSQSNKGTGVLSVANYGIARAAMAGFKDANGQLLKIIGDLLVVPPQLEKTAREILNAETISGSTNVWRNSAELLVVPDLAGDATKWYLFCTKRPVKPFIFQQRKKATFQSFTKETDEHVFKLKKLLYGTDCRDNAGYGLWQLAYGSDGTV